MSSEGHAGNSWSYTDTQTMNFDEETANSPHEPEDADESTGRVCELRSYDCRIDSKGLRIRLKTGSKQALEYRDQSDFDNDAAMVYMKTFGSDKKLTKTELQIKSPYIKRALRKVVKSYPNVNIGSSSHVIIIGSPTILFHYWHELDNYGATHPDPEVAKHVNLCLGHMFSCLSMDIQEYLFSTELSTADPLNPWFQYDYLWMLFRPGDLIFSKSGAIESVSRLIDDVKNGVLNLESMTCQKSTFEPRQHSVTLPRYDGWKPLQDLSHIPLKYHNEQARVKSELIDRGKKYVSLLGLHYRGYYPPQSSLDDSQDRIVIDYKPYVTKVRRDMTAVFARLDEDDYDNDEDRLHALYATSNATTDSLSDNDYLICSSTIEGFSLTTKKSGEFAITYIEEISFDSSAFECLVLSESKKQLILSLVDSQGQQSSLFDDLIKGKGRGIILLLHGPPGVGKTFTAESISEYTKRPLYTLSCTDLGHDAEAAERKLNEAFGRAKRWNAIVLLDEADVFMAERTMEHLDRNELVSVLLRGLDYFQGIMILTTNRVEVIDAAFKSRVHFSIAYPDLTASSRATLWDNFIARRHVLGRPRWLDDGFLENISQTEMNGRQIRNAVRVAHALAARQGRFLAKEDVTVTLEALCAFQKEFNSRFGKRKYVDPEDDRAMSTAKRTRPTGAAH